MPGYNDILNAIRLKADRLADDGRLSPEDLKMLDKQFFPKLIVATRGSNTIGFRQVVLQNGVIYKEGTSRINYVLQHLLTRDVSFRQALISRMQANNGRMPPQPRLAYELNQVQVLFPEANPLTQFLVYVGKAAKTSDPRGSDAPQHEGKDAGPLIDPGSVLLVGLKDKIRDDQMRFLDAEYGKAILRAFDAGPVLSDSIQEVLGQYGREMRVREEKSPQKRGLTALFGPPPGAASTQTMAPPPVAAPSVPRALRRCTPEQRAALEVMRDDNGVPEVVELDSTGTAVVGYVEGTAAEKIAQITAGMKEGVRYLYPCGGKDKRSAGYKLLAEMAKSSRPGAAGLGIDDF